MPVASSQQFSPDVANAAAPGRAFILVLGALTALGPLAVDMYLPALPQISRDLALAPGRVQLTLSVFMIGLALGQAFYGPIADRWGRRGPLLAGLAVFVVAAIGCAGAQSLTSLLGWRLVMALGGSASMVIPRAVVRDRFAHEDDSARVYSILMLILGVSPILAPSLGGQMLGWTGWREIFWVLAVIGGACAAAVGWGLPETLPRERREVGGVGLALRTYLRLLRDVRFLGAVLAAGFTLGALFAYLSSSSFVFIELHGLSPQAYALVFGFNAVGLIGASQLNRWLLRRHSLPRVLLLGFGLNAAAGVLLVLAAATGWGGMAALIGLIFLSMSAAGIIFPNVAALAMAPHGEVAGSASALLGVFQFGLGAASGALVGMLHNGTVMPMAVGLAVCTLAGLVVVRTMALR